MDSFEAPVDISSMATGPAARLSNFTERHFVLDGIVCASIEGVLQSLKFSDAQRQREVCGLIGSRAKKEGRGADWRASQLLNWQGEDYPRDSEAYQGLLDRLFQTVYEQDPSFAEDLRATGSQRLVHSIGKSDPTESVLTEREFCERLESLRERSSGDCGL